MCEDSFGCAFGSRQCPKCYELSAAFHGEIAAIDFGCSPRRYSVYQVAFVSTVALKLQSLNYLRIL
jgi:hypothetical protein